MTEEIQEQEPIIIETKGMWVDFEEITEQTFEEGKTYDIKVGGKCQFMIAPKKPIGQGLRANEITYTKEENNKLWIKTR